MIKANFGVAGPIGALGSQFWVLEHGPEVCKIFFYSFVVLEYVDFHLTSLKAETINSSTE